MIRLFCDACGRAIETSVWVTWGRPGPATPDAYNPATDSVAWECGSRAQICQPCAMRWLSTLDAASHAQDTQEAVTP